MPAVKSYCGHSKSLHVDKQPNSVLLCNISKHVYYSQVANFHVGFFTACVSCDWFA